MEFWGVEVKPGQQLECSPGEDKYIHLSQVAIGEGSKSDDRVAVYIHVDGKKIMIGSCVRGSCEQFGLDLVFEKDFKISHTSKSASVFCCGYTTFIQEEDEFGSLNGEDEDDDSESEDEVPPLVATAKENGAKQPVKAEKVEKSESGSVPGKSNKAVTKEKLEKPKQPAKVEEDDDDEEDDEDEDMEDISEDDDDDDEEDEDEDSDEDEEDESDEETPKPLSGKKRPMPDSAAKTPVSDKKAKFATPDSHKPDKAAAREYWESLILAGKGNEGDKKQKVHVATPHPGAKKGDKKGKETPGGPKQETPASKETPKSNASTSASAKKFSCQACQRSFISESALNSHNSAKHGGKS